MNYIYKIIAGMFCVGSILDSVRGDISEHILAAGICAITFAIFALAETINTRISITIKERDNE